MNIAVVLTPPTDQNFRFASQAGATDFVARNTGLHTAADLRAVQERAAGFGMRVGVVEGYLPIDPIVHAKPERDEKIDEIGRLIVMMGEVGVPVLCYNFMPYLDWTRTDLAAPERGGARSTGFDLETFRANTGPVERGITSDRMWENLAYFLKRIVPIAEEAGVQLAMHPDDPPLPNLAGHDQIMYSPECFERLFEIDPSPNNGMCFCQGTFAEMGVDIPATIRRLGERIRYVHFRDVVGGPEKFVESFHDNGQTDMFAAVQAYREVGFEGAMRPDHVPMLEGETGEPGYTILGRLFAIGYMRGLLDALGK